MAKIRIGTRGSRLALAQANNLRAQLLELEPTGEVEIVTIKTSGDRGDRDRLGAFVREIQDALLQETVDVALHCLKDLPTQQVPGLRLSAHLQREDPRDALIAPCAKIQDLPSGAVVGTGSVRRTSQLAALRPDLQFKPLVGNVDTRLRKLQAGEYDGIILAIAGLKRLGVLDTWAESEFRELLVTPLSVDVMLPAPGQAVLVLETRQSDEASHRWTSRLASSEAERCASAERSFLAAFGGGCSVPVAALANASGSSLELTGLVAAPDGSTVLRGSRSGLVADGALVAEALANELKGQGALDLFTPDPRTEGA